MPLTMNNLKLAIAPLHVVTASSAENWPAMMLRPDYTPWLALQFMALVRRMLMVGGLVPESTS